MRTLALILIAIGLTACKADTIREEFGPDNRVTARVYTGGSVDYARYVEAASRQPAPAVDATACQGDARCVENVAAFAALAAVAGGGQSKIQAPAPKRTGWDRVESIASKLIGVTPSLGGQFVALKASEHSRDVSINRDNTTRDIAVSGLTGMADVASTSIAFARPSFYAGHDMVIGNQHHGDAVTGDGNATGGSQVGDDVGGDQIGGDSAGRDIAGGDIVDNSGVIGDNNETRIDSPGPYDIDNSENGGDCTDSDCSTDPGDGG